MFWKLFKSSFTYLKRSRGLVAFIFLLPILLIIIGAALQSYSAGLYFYTLSYSISAISSTFIAANQIGYEMISSSLYKKIIIYTGVKKWVIFVPLLIVFICQMINYAIISILLLIILKITNGMLFDYAGVFYGFLTATIFSLFLASFFYTLIKNRNLMYSLSIFLGFFLLIFSDGYITRFGSTYIAISYLNPYKYMNIMIFESMNRWVYWNNYLSSEVFNLNPLITVYTKVIINDDKKPIIINDFLIILSRSDKIASMFMPWVFSLILIGFSFKLDILKRTRYN